MYEYSFLTYKKIIGTCFQVKASAFEAFSMHTLHARCTG